MADVNRLRSAEPVDQAGDDPFAELTRIMGFDPREPFSKQKSVTAPPPAANVDVPAPQRVSAPAVAAEADDLDFSIDLEGELMGALETPEEARYSDQVPERVAAPQVAYAMQPSFSTQPRYAPQHPAYSAPAQVSAPSLDEEAYLLTEESLAFEDELSARAEFDHVAATDFQPQAVDEQDAYGAFASAGAYNDVTEMDYADAVEAADEPAAMQFEGDPVARYEEPATAAIDDTLDMDRRFDDAMAEVDMDFSEDLSTARWQPDVAPQARAVAEEFAMPAEAPHQDPWSLQADSAFDSEIGDLMAREMEVVAQPEPASAEASEVSEEEIDDAIAELAKMVRSYERPAPVQIAQPVEPASSENLIEEDFFDIDTMEVPEGAVPLADELDIPDVSYAEEPPVTAFDDLDADIAAAFNDSPMERVQPARAEDSPAPDFDLGFGYQTAAVAGGVAAAPYAAPRFAGQAQASAPSSSSRYDDFEVERDLEDDLVYEEMPAPQAVSPRRNYMLAAIVGGVVILGGIGAYALSGNGSIAGGEPALVKADVDPIKVRPANPGGSTVPNQQSQVFDKAVGAPAQPSTQDALVKTTEEPVDMAERFPEELPQPFDESADIEGQDGGVPKSEDRIQQSAADQAGQPAAEMAAVQPRKVRTMIVKPDGSLVAREEVAPAEQAPATATGSAPQQTASGQPAPASSQEIVPAPTNETTQAIPAKPAASSAMPDKVPVAPNRPADQPVDVVGEVKPDQVAALAPNAAAAAGSWSMQIASQPTEAAAQSTYQDLSRRYASVLSGKQASIAKAEIAGKGTFWRVRVPAGSRNEAVSMCESYKSAGGNCFVSK